MVPARRRRPTATSRATSAAPAASRPKFAMFELRLEDLMGVAYASDRSLRDAQGLESIVRTAFESEFAFAVDDEIINGSGAGQCEGVLNAAALVIQAKETGQTAATVKAENIIKMRSRLWPRGRSRAVWLINADVEPELHTMSLTIGTGGGLPRKGGQR